MTISRHADPCASQDVDSTSVRLSRVGRLDERTAIHHIRREFFAGFGVDVGADLIKEANRLRAQRPELAASAVLVHWHGATPTSMTRLVHHPPGVEAPIALVAGRHSRCDLGSIPGASLRHALILLWPPGDEAGKSSAEVLDLGTQTGIALVDGRLAARFASSEPIRFGIGNADVVIVHATAGQALPLGPDVFASRLGEISEQAELTLHANQPYTRHLDVSESGELREMSPDGAAPSCVVLPVQASREHILGSEHAMLTQMIRLGDGPMNARVQVRAQDLERGVRLGRYLRCRGASVLGRDDRVSRVHALVLDRGGHRWLFDTASTNGTKVVDVDTGEASGPVRGQRTFTLLDGQTPSLAGQVALLDVGTPQVPS